MWRFAFAASDIGTGYLRRRADAKWSDAPCPLGAIVDTE